MRADEAAAKARSEIAVPWDEVRAARVQRRVASELTHPPTRSRATVEPESKLPIDRSRARARSLRWIAAFAAALVMLAAIGLFAQRRPSPTASTHLDFADGSRVTFDPSEHVVPEIISDTLVQVRQSGGAASYDVAHRPSRTFVIWVGDVRVEVLGTVFRVEKLASAVHVAVTRGRVRVTRGSRTVVLAAGEDVTLQNGDGPEPSSSTAVAPSASSDDDEPPPPAIDSALLTAPSASAAADEPSAADLFRQADDARASGNPTEALRLLRLLVSRYPHDGRVTAAVFTIGRLESLRGHYADAALAFESCGRSLQGEALAEAALARSAAGQPGAARRLANQYIDNFPNGPRARELDRLR